MRQSTALTDPCRADRGPDGRRRTLRPRIAGPAALALGASILLLAGCEAPPEARFPISEAAAARPTPELGETDRFKRAAEASIASADTLGTDRADLAARAAALRGAAAALSALVLDDETRAGLIAARETGAAPAAE